MGTLYVPEQGSYVRKDGGVIVVMKAGKATYSVPMVKVDRVVVMGLGVQVSTAALVALTRAGIPVFFTDEEGARTWLPVVPAPINNALPRLAQALLVQDGARALPLVRAIVQGKLANQAALLRAHSWPWGVAGARTADALDRLGRQAAGAETGDQARGYEGAGAAAYWGGWVTALAGKLAFDPPFAGRGYHPPPDAVNALLSFGYTLLLQETITAAQMAGLDPAFGFFHVMEFGRPSTALDLEEEFRAPVVDDLVLGLLEAAAFGPADFGPGDKPRSVYLNDRGRQRFIAAYEGRMQQRVLYPHSPRADGKALSETWRRCVFLQAQQLARVVQDTPAVYQPLVWPRPAPAAARPAPEQEEE